MIIKIKRQLFPGAKPYIQTIAYDGPRDISVAALLDTLNSGDDLRDENGETIPRISWECSCLQGMCGACAMVINGRPALACETFLRDMEGDTLVLEPLSKFPVVSDLVTDRSAIQNNLLESNAYIQEYSASDPSEYEHRYIAAKCLKCGLCLEVCPNYTGKGDFYGAYFANDCYLISSRSAGSGIKKEYDRHFAPGCSGALSCVDICPMKIPTIASMAKMNRRR